MLLPFVSDSAQGNGSDAQVGGNVVLRNALYDFGMVFQEVFVPFPGIVFDLRKKEVGVMAHALEKDVLKPIFQIGVVDKQSIEVGFANDDDGGGLYAFDVELAGFPAGKTFQRGDGLPFHEKLKCHILSIVVEPNAQAAFFDKVQLFSDGSFFQQQGFGCHLLFAEGGPDFFPMFWVLLEPFKELMEHDDSAFKGKLY